MRPLFFSALAVIAASGSVVAATDNDRLQDWVRLDSEIQRATKALTSDAEGSRPAVEELLKRVDAINGALDAGRDESMLSRAKRSALGGPLYNLRLALGQPAMASRMAMRTAQARGPLMSADGVAGVSCEQAIELVAGQPMRIEIPTNSSRWIAVRSPLGASAPLAVTTMGSEIDAAVNVYADCRETTNAAISSGDDNYGLQAIALLPPAAHPLMVELRNQSQRGIATIDAVTAVTINGRVTRSDTAAPIYGMRIEAYQGGVPASTQFVGQTSAQNNGDYQLVTYASGVTQNTYVRTKNSSYDPLFVNEAWDNVACSVDYGLSSCGPGLPTAVATEDGGTVSNIDFALSPGATIHGQVLARSGTPVSGGSVSVNQVGATPSAARTTRTDASGRYIVGALANGQYRVVASENGYMTQVFSNLDCDLNCGQIAGTPVPAIEFGQSLANFSLSRSNTIRVTLSVDGQSIDSYGSAQLYAVNPAGMDVANATTNNMGVVLLGPLPAGTYRVRAQGFGMISEYYQDIVCAGVCGPAEFQAATMISVSNDAPPVEIAMELARVPELSGIVSDTSGAPIGGAVITLFGSSYQATATTNGDGTYRVRAPALGAYSVLASSPNHVDELFDNIPCNNFSTVGTCPGGTLVNFSVGVAPSPVNFELAPSAKVRGRVSKLPVGTSFQVFALTSLNASTYDGVFSAQSDGIYQLSDLSSGEFRFGFQPISYGRLKLFENIDCGPQAYNFAQCPVSGATSVSVAAGSIVDGIDFTYRSKTGRLGQVTDEATGLPLAGIIIDGFNSQSLQLVKSITSDIDGRFDIGPDYSSESFVLATDNFRGYRNEVYNNIQCAVGSSVYLGTCPLTGATPIVFPGDASEIFIALRRDDAVFHSGFD